MTVKDICDAIHVAYEQATDTPAISDDDGVMRINLINKGIRRWATEDGVRWRELDVLNAIGPTVVAGQVVYPITQTDFKELGSKLRLIKTDGSLQKYSIVTTEYYTQNMDGNGLVLDSEGKPAVCITGNPAVGYTINLGWIPNTNDGTVGGVMYFDYYKYANKVSLMTDIPEMSNPNFLIAYAVAELFVNDDVNLYTKFNGDALNDLSNMRVVNDALPPYASNAIENQGSADSIVMGV